MVDRLRRRWHLWRMPTPERIARRRSIGNAVHAAVIGLVGLAPTVIYPAAPVATAIIGLILAAAVGILIKSPGEQETARRVLTLEHRFDNPRPNDIRRQEQQRQRMKRIGALRGDR